MYNTYIKSFEYLKYQYEYNFFLNSKNVSMNKNYEKNRRNLQIITIDNFE